MTRLVTAWWKRPACEAMFLKAWVKPGYTATLEVDRNAAEALGYKEAGKYKLILTAAPGAYVGELSGIKYFIRFRDKMIGARPGQPHIRCCFLPKGWRSGKLIRRELFKL